MFDLKNIAEKMNRFQSNQNSVFIGNLDNNVHAAELEANLFELMSQCGIVVSMRVPAEGGKLRGFAFVEFNNAAAVLYATLAINGVSFYNRILRVACAMDDEKDLSLRLESIPSSESELSLFEALSPNVADIRGISFAKRNLQGKNDGRAIVWFKDRQAKEEAASCLSSPGLGTSGQLWRVHG